MTLRWVVRLAVLLCLTFPVTALAQTFDTCTPSTTTATPASYTLVLDQNATIGPVGAGWLTLSEQRWSCQRTGTGALDVRPMVKVDDSAVTASSTVSLEGENYRRYTLVQNGQEVGFVARWRSHINGHGSGWRAIDAAPQQSDASAQPTTVNISSGESYNAAVEVQVRLFKTSATSPAPNAVFDFAALRAWLVTQRFISAAPQPEDTQPDQVARVSVSFPRTNAACTTPDVNVTLPPVSMSTLPAINSTGPAQAFEMRLENCPAALAKVEYKFQAIPHQTINNGVLPLQRASTAQGFSVQILENNSPLVFDIWRNLGAYDPASPNPLYTVPLAARIIRTHAQTKPGSVNAAMNMSVRYQ